MRRIRVIPTLLLDSNGGLVKTVKFGKRTYIGDPINAVKIFNDKGADELVLLDIDASRSRKAPNFEMIEDIVSEAFMPVGYGGGITTVDQMATLLRCGLEKVIVSTAAHESPTILCEASDRFGSQSVVACLDVKKTWLAKPTIYSRGGTVSTKTSPVDAAQRAVTQGAGELIVYAIDRDGTYSGYDLPVLSEVSNAVSVPVIACGGARNIDDFHQAVTIANCSAVAAGSQFVYQSAERGVLISYPSQSEFCEHLFERV